MDGASRPARRRLASTPFPLPGTASGDHSGPVGRSTGEWPGERVEGTAGVVRSVVEAQAQFSRGEQRRTTRLVMFPIAKPRAAPPITSEGKWAPV